jgi:hypothetical protein
MIWWKKTKAWCLAHWRWLIFGIASLFALIFGYSKSREWKIQSEISRKNYKREKEIIEKTNKAHVEDVIEAHEVHDKAHERNVLSFEKKMKELKKEKARRMLEESNTSPEAIDRFLEEKGIEKE